MSPRRPFEADPSGQKDATAALQRAFEYARAHRMAVFFPVGTYTVSDTLEYAISHAAVRRGQESPCMMIGSRKGPHRPKIVLAPNSKGFQNPKAPKNVVHIWAQGPKSGPNTAQPNISYNQVFLNIDIEIGKGNPGAIAIHHVAAQGSGIEDVTINAGDGYAGIVGLQAGGGGTHNVTVIGGRYGLDASKALATAATVSGATFIGQKASAILYGGHETLCLVGARIVVPRGATGPAIQGVGSGPTQGPMCIVDTQIIFESANANSTAIASNRSVYLNNVWVKQSGKIVETSDGGSLDGNTNGWRQVNEFAHGVRPPKMTDRFGGVQLEHVCYLDGKRTTSDVVSLSKDGRDPPEDLQSRHVWDRCPSWESPSSANVKEAPYNAKGDGKTDDTEVLDRAIREKEVIFLPKGRYSVSKTLNLRPDTKLIGLRQLSVIQAQKRNRGDFTDPAHPQPIVRSADDAHGTAALAYIGLGCEGDVPATMLHWRTGRDSVVRSIFTGSNPQYKSLRPTRISDHGGGRWYSLFRAARMSIEGTSEPLRLYQANPEWGTPWHMIVQKAADVTIYGFKNEGPNALWVADGDRISVFGYGGIANAPPGKSLFLVERTPNFRLAGLVDRVFKEGTPPTKWWMVSEQLSSGPTIQTKPLDRIVLYKRGFHQQQGAVMAAGASQQSVMLTPKPGPEPRINGPKVYGCRPGRPFLYRLPCTGKRPMTFAAKSLPPTLKLDPATGIVTGRAPQEPGE